MPTQPTIRRIKLEVSKAFGVTVNELCGTSREAKIAKARAIAVMLCRREISPPPSFPRIAREFHRHHSTAISLERRAHNLIDHEPEIFDKVRMVKEALRSQR
jgi:chromosomal replication initiation ATPase DnaA